MDTVRDKNTPALVVGLLLGFVGTFFVYIGGRRFEYLGAFLAVSFFFPLVVSLVATSRVILMGLIPNLIMTSCLTIYLLFFSPDFLGLDLLFVVPVMFGISAFVGLLPLITIQWWRRKQHTEEKVNHIFSRDEP